jgi:UDP-N-acetylmuramate dehydrogenase
MSEYAKRRNDKQPVDKPSAGSFFKRPPGQFAGALIEQAGLKGLKYGGASVSELHAGFIVSDGTATATDILMLAQAVEERVFEQTGVRLEPEPVIIGNE